VQFVSVPDVGVPRTGVTSVGEVARTTAPVPVGVMPPNDPALLYWMSPLDPPGVPPPPPAGVAQVPSPRQKVELDALVPPLRLATGKLPDTCEESEIVPTKADVV
jgi:hypothetical protein